MSQLSDVVRNTLQQMNENIQKWQIEEQKSLEVLRTPSLPAPDQHRARIQAVAARRRVATFQQLKEKYLKENDITEEAANQQNVQINQQNEPQHSPIRPLEPTTTQPIQFEPICGVGIEETTCPIVLPSTPAENVQISIPHPQDTPPTATSETNPIIHPTHPSIRRGRPDHQILPIIHPRQRIRPIHGDIINPSDLINRPGRPGLIIRPPQPIVEPVIQPVIRPIMRPCPIIRPQPIIRPDPITRPQPIIRPCPIIRPQPIIRPCPIIRPQPIIRPTPCPVIIPEPSADEEKDKKDDKVTKSTVQLTVNVMDQYGNDLIQLITPIPNDKGTNITINTHNYHNRERCGIHPPKPIRFADDNIPYLPPHPRILPIHRRLREDRVQLDVEPMVCSLDHESDEVPQVSQPSQSSSSSLESHDLISTASELSQNGDNKSLFQHHKRHCFTPRVFGKLKMSEKISENQQNQQNHSKTEEIQHCGFIRRPHQEVPIIDTLVDKETGNIVINIKLTQQQLSQPQVIYCKPFQPEPVIIRPREPVVLEPKPVEPIVIEPVEPVVVEPVEPVEPVVIKPQPFFPAQPDADDDIVIVELPVDDVVEDPQHPVVEPFFPPQPDSSPPQQPHQPEQVEEQQQDDEIPFYPPQPCLVPLYPPQPCLVPLYPPQPCRVVKDYHVEKVKHVDECDEEEKLELLNEPRIISCTLWGPHEDVQQLKTTSELTPQSTSIISSTFDLFTTQQDEPTVLHIDNKQDQYYYDNGDDDKITDDNTNTGNVTDDNTNYITPIRVFEPIIDSSVESTEPIQSISEEDIALESPSSSTRVEASTYPTSPTIIDSSPTIIEASPTIIDSSPTIIDSSTPPIELLTSPEVQALASPAESLTSPDLSLRSLASPVSSTHSFQSPTSPLSLEFILDDHSVEPSIGPIFDYLEYDCIGEGEDEVVVMQPDVRVEDVLDQQEDTVEDVTIEQQPQQDITIIKELPQNVTIQEQQEDQNAVEVDAAEQTAVEVELIAESEQPIDIGIDQQGEVDIVIQQPTELELITGEQEQEDYFNDDDFILIGGSDYDDSDDDRDDVSSKHDIGEGIEQQNEEPLIKQQPFILHHSDFENGSDDEEEQQSVAIVEDEVCIPTTCFVKEDMVDLVEEDCVVSKVEEDYVVSPIQEPTMIDMEEATLSPVVEDLTVEVIQDAELVQSVDELTQTQSVVVEFVPTIEECVIQEDITPLITPEEIIITPSIPSDEKDTNTSTISDDIITNSQSEIVNSPIDSTVPTIIITTESTPNTTTPPSTPLIAPNQQYETKKQQLEVKVARLNEEKANIATLLGIYKEDLDILNQRALLHLKVNQSNKATEPSPSMIAIAQEQAMCLMNRSNAVREEARVNEEIAKVMGEKKVVEEEYEKYQKQQQEASNNKVSLSLPRSQAPIAALTSRDAMLTEKIHALRHQIKKTRALMVATNGGGEDAHDNDNNNNEMLKNNVIITTPEGFKLIQHHQKEINTLRILEHQRDAVRKRMGLMIHDAKGSIGLLKGIGSLPGDADYQDSDDEIN